MAIDRGVSIDSHVTLKTILFNCQYIAKLLARLFYIDPHQAICSTGLAQHAAIAHQPAAMLLAAQRVASRATSQAPHHTTFRLISFAPLGAGRGARRSTVASLSRSFAGETPAAASRSGGARQFADSAAPPKPKTRAKPRARGGEAVGQRTLGQFAADNWAYGVFGTILAGAGLFVFQCMQEGRNPMKELRNTIDEFFENTEALSDPDPEQFGIQFLQMGGNPIQHVPMYAQDGEKVSPIVTIVFAMEGTLVKRTHDVSSPSICPRCTTHPSPLHSASTATDTFVGQQWAPC